MLQSEWEGENSGFIHLPRAGLTAGNRPEYPYAISSVLEVLRQTPLQEPSSFVFHAQSSLPLLLTFYVLRRLFRNGHQATIVYDIHDLHERDPYGSLYAWVRYGILRYYPLLWLERWAVSRPDIAVMTVSEGLADTIVGWYGCNRPTVVYSAMKPQHSASELRATARIPRSLLFFGTAERLPFELIDNVGRAGLELHLYGRFDGRAGVERTLGRALPDHVKIHGEYHPSDLAFISRYEYLLIYKPNDLRANFRYSLPNKFFQSLAHGTSLILSPNFEEMVQIVATVPGACAVLEGEPDLIAAIADLDRARTDRYWDAVIALGHKLHDVSRRCYLSLTGKVVPEGRQAELS